MLGHFRTLLEDVSYVQRIKRHYSMFRAAIAADPPVPERALLNRAQRRAARRKQEPRSMYG